MQEKSNYQQITHHFTNMTKDNSIEQFAAAMEHVLDYINNIPQETWDRIADKYIKKAEQRAK